MFLRGLAFGQYDPIIVEEACIDDIELNFCFVDFFNENVENPAFKTFQWELSKTRDYDNSILFFEISINNNKLDISTLKNLNGDKFDNYTKEIISILVNNINKICECKIDTKVNYTIKMTIGVAIFGHFRSVHMEAW